MSEQAPKPSYAERWAGALERARKSQDLKALLEAEDAPKRIAQAPTPELYFAIQQYGLADSLDILEYITPTQLQGFIDLGAWRHDRFEVEASVSWLSALASISKEKLWALTTAVDEEWLLILLRRYITVYDSPDEVPDELEEDTAVQSSPDMQNTLVIQEAQGNGALAALILEGFFVEDVIQGRRVMEACRAELDIELEEEALRFRNGRLADLGFLSREEAIELYVPRDPAKIIAQRTKSPVTIDLELLRHTGLPALFLEPMEVRGVLSEALGAPGSEDIARRFMLELPSLINRVLAANDADLGDLERIEQLTKHARGILEIGIKHLKGPDELRRLALQEVFRVGWWQIVQLQPRALALVRSTSYSLLGERNRAAVKALSAHMPHFSLALARPPGEGLREFMNEDELRLAQSALEQAEVSHALLTLMKIDADAPSRLKQEHKGAAPIEAATLFGTALSNALLGRAFTPAPLAINELAALKAKLFAHGEITPEVTKGVQDTLASLPAHLQETARKTVSFWLASLVDEISRLVLSPMPEARFVGGVLLKG